MVKVQFHKKFYFLGRIYDKNIAVCSQVIDVLSKKDKNMYLILHVQMQIHKFCFTELIVK